MAARIPRQIAGIHHQPAHGRGVEGWQQLGSVERRVERFFIPDEVHVGGEVDYTVVRARYRRMVIVVCGASIAAFAPSLPLAGVPPGLWLPFLAGAIGAAVSIAISLLVVPPNTLRAYLAAGVSALAIFGLDRLIGAYYHQAALLFALVVAGHAVIAGLRPALAMVAAGALIVPFTTTLGSGAKPTDAIFAFLYLLGLTLVIWTYARLTDRGGIALRQLVERVPAVVYTADVGVEGAWHYVSPRAHDLLGFPAAAWTSDPSPAGTHPHR